MAGLHKLLARVGGGGCSKKKEQACARRGRANQGASSPAGAAKPYLERLLMLQLSESGLFTPLQWGDVRTRSTHPQERRTT